MIETALTAFRAPDIRRKLLFTLGILLIFRALTNVPIPNVNTAALTNLFTDNPLLGILNIFSGGGLAAASIIGLGVNPYINASIIMQLMRGVIPALEELSREGEYGRNRLNQYTRMLTVPLAFAQGYGISVLLSANGVIPANPLFSVETLSLLLSFTAGTILLMWLGELISERGLGNGISFIIFAGIVGSIPQQIGPIVSGPDALARLIPFVIVAIVVVAAVVFINEGQRRIPVQYASRVRGRRMYQGQTQYLPLKVTMAGVIPIIFAVSILLFPAQIATYFTDQRHRLGAQRRDLHQHEPERARPTSRCTGRSTSCWSSSSRTSTPRSSSGPTRRPTTCARTAASSPASGPGKPTEEFLGAGHEPDHAGRCALPRVHRRAAVHRLGLHPRHEQPPARRHEHPDHGQRRGRDDEAARGADDDASLRGLHPMTDEPVRDRADERLILLLVGAVGAGKGTQAEALSQELGLAAPRLGQPVPRGDGRRHAARRGGALVHGARRARPRRD